MHSSTTIPEPTYTVQPSETGLRFHPDEETAAAWAADHDGRVVPAQQVDPEIRAEGRAWLAAR